MQNKLLSNLDKDVTEKMMRASFTGSYIYRNQLTKVLEREKDNLIAKMIKDSNFESPNWALEQARIIAEIKAIEKTLLFLK